MKTVAALAVIASLFALMAPDTGAEAKKIKLRIHEHRSHDNWKLSCNTARHMVLEKGYYPVKAKNCGATVYSFRAVRKGRVYIVYVHSRTGFVWLG
jgi:hypothetical protein